MGDLHAAERLNHLDEVLLEHGVVEAHEVALDEDVAAELEAVPRQRGLVVLQAAVRVGARDGLHRLEVQRRVFLRRLAGEQARHVVGRVEHDFAEQHVLQRGRRFGGVVERGVAVQGLDEVREGRGEVAVFGVQHAALHVQTGLQERGGVHARGGGAGGGERGAGFGLVSEGVVDAGLEQLDFDEDDFVVEAFELFEEGVDEREGVVVGLLGHVERYEAGFEGLPEKGAPLGYRPFYA